MTRHTSPPREFAEADYCYGIGPLRVRIEHIDWANPVRYDNDTWYHVDGVELSSSGAERQRRRVLVRGRRLSAPPPGAATKGDPVPRPPPPHA